MEPQQGNTLTTVISRFNPTKARREADQHWHGKNQPWSTIRVISHDTAINEVSASPMEWQAAVR